MMAVRSCSWLVLMLCLTLTGCATAPTSSESFRTAADTESLDEDENRFWLMADQGDEQIENLGILYDDPELDMYLQKIMDDLFPEFQGKIRIRAIKDAELNAFAMANGSIYMNIGMLTRLNNEAEMAAVFGHEGIHFTERHVVHGMRNMKSTMVLTQLLSMAGGGVYSSLAGMSSVMGYSRELEAAADSGGFIRLRSAGYDVHQAGGSFARFAREMKARDINGDWFFASHPKLETRAANFDALADRVDSGGMINQKMFLESTGRARLDALVAMAEKGDYDTLIHILETEERLDFYPPHARYFLGEAYRIRAKDGDEDRALQFYTEAVLAADGFAPSYGRLGLLRMKRGENTRAIANFSRYLELAPQAPDRAYIKKYLEQLSGDTQ